MIFNQCVDRGNERLHFFCFPNVGLKAIMAVNSTVLGPAIGGCRMMDYEDDEKAIEDVLRLAEGMTYKNSLAGINHGGGKSVIIADPKMKEGREALFRQFGKCLQSLAGTYYSAEDMGTSVEDVSYMQKETNYICGTSEENGGAGDPSPFTARGVFSAIQGALDFKFNSKDLNGKHVHVQGVGHVGEYLVKFLREENATVSISDINQENLARVSKEYECEVVDLNQVYDTECDIYAPCAVGQTVNPDTIKRLKCNIIAGAANNQLLDASVYELIEEKGILYCPDFVINSGGVINVAGELLKGGYDKSWVDEKVSAIAGTTLKVLNAAKERGKFTEIVALELAKERINNKKNLAA